MFEIAKARITVERYPDRIPTFETWKETRRAA
jgi:hypothetical protein